jgi:hypothetical protein
LNERGTTLNLNSPLSTTRTTYNPPEPEIQSNPLHPSEGRVGRGARGWLGLAIDFYAIYAKSYKSNILKTLFLL